MSYQNGPRRSNNRETSVQRTTDDENQNLTNENSNVFIGIDKLLQQFYRQLDEFRKWYQNQDWLAFHHHHYDWWMFPIDEISSRGSIYAVPHCVIKDLKRNRQFIEELREGVYLMVCSWGWDIENHKMFDRRDENQKWSYWPVRLYKAGKCMWLFGQDDYYESLRKLAFRIREKEKLDYFSHKKSGKADVIEQWDEMEKTFRP